MKLKTIKIFECTLNLEKKNDCKEEVSFIQGYTGVINVRQKCIQIMEITYIFSNYTVILVYISSTAGMF